MQVLSVGNWLAGLYSASMSQRPFFSPESIFHKSIALAEAMLATD
ncbi:MAG: hypothetical protein ACI9R3_003793 [Verrucomicrobiales bacterium]|jgi:hypothetical protein